LILSWAIKNAVLLMPIREGNKVTISPNTCAGEMLIAGTIDLVSLSLCTGI
jgi:hypothetical protein